MLEEIADSMTAGGVLAATVGFCVALLALLMRVRERNLREPVTPGSGADRDGNPGERSGLPPASEVNAQPPVALDAPVSADRPASAFKPYVPPKKSL